MTGQIYEFDARPGGTYRMALTYRRDHPNAGKTSEDTDVVERPARVHAVKVTERPDGKYAVAGRSGTTWQQRPRRGR